MERVTNTKQLTKGQKVVMIDQTKGFTVNEYKFICEDILINRREIKEHYGYFVDTAGNPIRFFLEKEIGMPVFKNYTSKELYLCAKKYHEDVLAYFEIELSNMN